MGEWCRTLEKGRTNVHHDEGGQERKTVVIDEIVERVEITIRESRRFTVSDQSLDFPKLPRSSLYDIVTQRLGYHKV